jgi:hypothetical protein
VELLREEGRFACAGCQAPATVKETDLMASKDERDIAETVQAASLARQEGRSVFAVSTQTEFSKTTYPAWHLAGLIEAVEREG